MSMLTVGRTQLSPGRRLVGEEASDRQPQVAQSKVTPSGWAPSF